ncbi:MAG: substrate-binding domain-containing protein, partial [Aeromonas salmonicida]
MALDDSAQLGGGNMTSCWQRCLFWAAVTLFVATEVSAKPTIGMVLKSIRNEFFVEMTKGAQSYVQAHPDALTLQIEGIQQEVDVTGQEAIIRRMITQKVDALIVTPSDSVAMLPVLMEAIRAGILVINMDNKLDDRVLV